VNHGDIEGSDGYGISNYVNEANNLVSLGIVRSIVEEGDAYSFWPVSGRGIYSNLYGMDGRCKNCECDEYSVILITKDSKMKSYIISSNDKENQTRVDDILNFESNDKNYGMFWSEELEHEEQLSVKITIETKPKIERQVNYGVMMKDITEIEPYSA